MRKPPPVLALAPILALVLAAPLAAAAMAVPLDHTARLSVHGAAASVVVGNPAIADVTVVDSHTLYVSGRGYGSTDIIVLDRSGRTLYSGDITVAAAGSSVSVYRGAARTSVVCAPACADSSAPTAQQKFFGAMSEMMSQARTQAAANGAAAPAPSPALAVSPIPGAP